MNLETISKVSKLDRLSSNIFDYYDDDYDFDCMDVSRQRDTIAKLIPRLMAAQREYLMFLNAIETHFRSTVISTHLQAFLKILEKKPGLVELVQAHRTFILNAADHQCLSDRGAKVLEIIYRCIEAAITFGQECRDLESSLELRDERLDEIVCEKYSRIKRTLFQTRQYLCLLLNIIQTHYQKGVEASSMPV